MVIASLLTMTAFSLWFRQSKTLRVTAVALLLVVISGQVWMLCHVGRTIFPLDRPAALSVGERTEDADAHGLVSDTFDEGAFVALKNADEVIRRRVSEIWGFAVCLALLAMRPVVRGARRSDEPESALPQKFMNDESSH